MIYFFNKSEAPLEALFTLGVSVKTEGSIGYFGTGFKFALATLLRTGHKVWLNDEPFGLRTAKIRGEPFNIVTFAGRDLGFTDQLGRNWEVWQAFRELHANALDEGGTSTRIRPEAETVIAVAGAGIEKAFDNRHLIFIEAPILLQNDNIKVHAGICQYVYYRGVRAGSLPLGSQNTYNILQNVGLSDDRTVLSLWRVEARAAEIIAGSYDEDLIEKAVLASDVWWESTFSYMTPPSPAFLRVVGRNKENGQLNPSAYELFLAHTGEKGKEPDTIALTPHEEVLLAQALELCDRLGCHVEPEEIAFCESLGEGVMGMCRKGQIYIAHPVFDKGHRYLAATIYEEWLHKVHKFSDCSRSLQNFLFDKLFATIDGAQS